MEKISIADTVSLSSPHLFALLVTQDIGKRLNVMGVSWFSFASLKPPQMVLSLSNRGYTGQLLRETGRFTISLPLTAAKGVALACCRCSGRETDKTEKFNIQTALPDNFTVPVVADSKIAWELKLAAEMPAGDHTVFLADIIEAVKISDSRNLYAIGGYKDLDTLG